MGLLLWAGIVITVLVLIPMFVEHTTKKGRK